MDNVTVVQDELGKVVAVLANSVLFYQCLPITYEKVKHTVGSERVPATLPGSFTATKITVTAENGRQDIFVVTEMRVQRHADHL